MVKRPFLLCAWLIAFMGTILSLLIGEIFDFEPCNLCWYQRICLFPLSIILAIAVYRDDRKVGYYTIPQVFIGFLIALYQFSLPYYQLYKGVVPKCSFGKSCLDSPFEFGFINFAFLSMLGFFFILVFLLLAFREKGYEEL